MEDKIIVPIKDKLLLTIKEAAIFQHRYKPH